MPQFKPKDFLATLVLLFVFSFKYMGFDGTLDGVLALIIGYYFVKRENGADSGR